MKVTVVMHSLFLFIWNGKLLTIRPQRGNRYRSDRVADNGPNAGMSSTRPVCPGRRLQLLGRGTTNASRRPSSACRRLAGR